MNIKLSIEQKNELKENAIMLLYTFLFFGITGSLAIGFVMLVSGAL